MAATLQETELSDWYFELISQNFLEHYFYGRVICKAESSLENGNIVLKIEKVVKISKLFSGDLLISRKQFVLK